jgi:phage FluMu gp28-like protein
MPSQPQTQKDAREQLLEQNSAATAERERQAEALTQAVAAAADRSTNPLHKLELEALRAMAEKHQLGTNANGWVNPFPESNPKSQLMQYGFEYWHDASRFKAMCASRQSGKDFNSEGEAAEDCSANAKRQWMIAAPSERQSLDSLDQQKLWAEAFGLMIEDGETKREGSHPETLLKSHEILYSNGSKAVAVPGRPDTVRGKSANVLLTEFDFFEDPLATWRAILPSITNPLRGGEKKIRVVSTPNGKGRMLDKIFNEEPKGKMVWSRHLVTIYHAVLMGLPVNIEEIRSAMDDDEGWGQEYECRFLDGSNVLLPYDVIALAESFDATEAWSLDMAGTSNATYLGIDFGRSSDPTVCWTLQRVGDILWTREVLVLKDVSTPEQERILSDRIRAASRVCFDYTGPGIGLGDYMVEKHQQWKPEEHMFGKVELCTFTAGFKRGLFPRLRRAFEAPTKLRIPVSRAIREDLHMMQQVINNGEYNYWSPRTREGHSDRCTALALCLRAADSETASCPPPHPLPKPSGDSWISAATRGLARRFRGLPG